MSNKQWLEGATYKFRKYMLNRFISRYSSNSKIAGLIGNNTFTVKRVDSDGKVIDLVEFRRDDLEIDYWFDADEMDCFALVVDLRDMNNTNNIRPVDDIIAEWLDKLQYVIENDNTVGYGLMLDSEDVLTLSTDFGDIIGSYGIYNIITNRYDLLQQEAKHKKNNDLMERKAKLEAELAEVNKELSEV